MKFVPNVVANKCFFACPFPLDYADECWTTTPTFAFYFLLFNCYDATAKNIANVGDKLRLSTVCLHYSFYLDHIAVRQLV